MRPYHHGNLRSTLIETGVELARAQGPEGVVLREVARRAGVSHNAAYRHFADRDELLGEIASVAAEKLEEHMRRRLDELDEPDTARLAVRRLHEVGRAYVEFALAEPGLFAVAFAELPAGDDDHRPDPSAEMAEVGPYQLLGQCLDDLVEVGAMPPERRLGADLGCWAAVHGFSVLCLTGPLTGLPPELRDAALQGMLEVVERGLTRP
ncbi:TetR/AcrR family transcriptional regulator [Nocardioides sp.]|uniref:TetR/AcrR family transcriptional regulator n=1 Tax=Nocardioides sp. TaxID=35761 RepID=UPI003528F1E5